jgi:4-hydroxybutyrate CoA-transferase
VSSQSTRTSARNAVSQIKSGQSVFIHGGAATPQVLIDALVERASELENVEILHLHTMGAAQYGRPEYRGRFKVTNLFVGKNLRGLVDLESIDYLPCFLSEIPILFRSGRRKIDVALISLSSPDPHGYCSLGPSVDVARAAIDAAEVVIAQVNRQLPRTHGAGMVPLSQVDAWIKVDEPLPEAPLTPIDREEKRIGELIAGMIEDGSTLQAGIGAIPDAALEALGSHKNLGLHSEMWSDRALDLIEKGVIDNSRKVVHPGISVASFCVGSSRVYRAIHDHPCFSFLPADYVNSSTTIARNPKVVAINSAVEIDLTGQVCADSIGSKVISGVGGQMDFIRGASLSPGGKPIIAMKSRTPKGRSKIVPVLSTGAGVVTTRAHVHYVVTEHGVADLFGKSIGERVKLLVSLAHPDDRETLERQWFDIFHARR